MRLAILCLALISLAGCSLFTFQPDARPMQVELEADTEQQPLRIIANLPLVEVQVNECGPYWFLIDTGAFCTIIDRGLAEDLQLVLHRRYGTLETDAGATTGPMHQARVQSLTVGSARHTDFDAYVTELDHLAEALDHPLGGVIGMPVIATGTWTVDYRRRRLHVAPAGGLAEAPDAMPMQWSGSTPAIPVRIDDHELHAEIDTGGSGGLELSDSDARQVPLDHRGAHERESLTLNGRAVETRVRLPGVLHVGKRSFRRPYADLSRGTVIGGDLLRRFVLTIDAESHRVRLEPYRRRGHRHWRRHRRRSAQ